MSYERNLIHARLVAERARLLHGLIGIDTHTLEAVPVFAEWTAANLLAHIGDYDALFVERFRLALEGREAEIESISDESTPDNPLAKRNAALQERIKDWDIDRSLKYFDDSRLEFLKLLAQVSDKDLKRVRKLSWGETTLYDWTRWRWRHDEGHAKDLRRWRKTLKNVDASGAKSVLMRALSMARLDFIMSMMLVPESERETRLVCGTWTLKDVVGHIADWNLYFKSKAYAMLGIDHQELPPWHPDWRVANEQLVEARRGQSWKQVFHDYDIGSVLLGAAFEHSTAEELNRPYSGDNSPYPTAYHCAWSALEHCLDHAAVIRKELPVNVPQRLKIFEGRYT